MFNPYVQSDPSILRHQKAPPGKGGHHLKALFDPSTTLVAAKRSVRIHTPRAMDA